MRLRVVCRAIPVVPVTWVPVLSVGGLGHLHFGNHPVEEVVGASGFHLTNLRHVGRVGQYGVEELRHGAVGSVHLACEADRYPVGSDKRIECDGFVTDVKNLPIMIYIADCVPVLLHDPEAEVIAAVHCGWKSSVQDILGAAVEKMCALGANPENIHAAIGASIGKCCFECDDDVPEAVERYLGGKTDGLFENKPNGKTHVDLRGANARRLEQLGLKRENIDVSEECTMCLPEKYWSHRATDGVRGSMAATIML